MDKLKEETESQKKEYIDKIVPMLQDGIVDVGSRKVNLIIGGKVLDDVWTWFSEKLKERDNTILSLQKMLHGEREVQRHQAFDDVFTDEDMQHLATRIDPAFYDIEIDSADKSKSDFLRKLKIIINDLLNKGLKEAHRKGYIDGFGKAVIETMGKIKELVSKEIFMQLKPTIIATARKQAFDDAIGICYSELAMCEEPEDEHEILQIKVILKRIQAERDKK